MPASAPIAVLPPPPRSAAFAIHAISVAGHSGLSGTHIVFLIAAGSLAGVVGTAGGITSLISFPALLAAGLGRLPADVANIVALVACWPGSTIASRPELRGRRRWLVRWGLVAGAAGAGGAGLLLATPSGIFARIVPFLVLIASVGLAAQPQLRRFHHRRSPRTKTAILAGGLPAVAAYNGYFGAGAGVMTLTLLMVAADEGLAAANACKNVLIGAATTGSALVLVGAGPVQWRYVAPLAGGMLIGSLIGPRVARRVQPDVLRWLVAVVGVAVAVQMWVSA